MKKPVTTLVVEDEEFVLQAVTDAAQKLGHHVLRARDAEEAAIALNAWGQYVHAILIDWSLPLTFIGGGLVETLTEIDERIPIVIITGYSEDVVRLSLPPRKGLYFLKKPFFLHELEAMLRQLRPVPREE